MKTLPCITRLAGPGTLLLLSMVAGHAWAQNSTSTAPASAAKPAAAQPSTAPATSAAPAPTDPQIESFKSMLVGSWKASGKEPATGDDAEFWMHIAPVTIEGVDNALYVEQCRGDDPLTPYRQAVFQVYRNRGKLRLRTIEFRATESDGGVWAQMWMVPDKFPAIDPAKLIATLDLEFTASGGGFDGKTPYPYPNADQGAVEMTSEMKVSKDKLVTTDKGYGPDGKVVWSTSGGSASADSLTWEHADPGFKVRHDDDGLIVITLAETDGATEAVDGDTLWLDYTFWLTDGTVIDSTQRRGRLAQMKLPLPAEGGPPPGLIHGLANITEGTVRKIIVPPSLGYGDAPHGQVPPDSTLIFRVEANTVQKPEPAPEANPGDQPPPDGGDGGGAPAGGGGH